MIGPRRWWSLSPPLPVTAAEISGRASHAAALDAVAAAVSESVLWSFATTSDVRIEKR